MQRTTQLWLTALLAGLLLGSPLMAGEKQAEKPTEKPTQKPAEEASPTIQLAILLDTSGSMDGLINQARTQLWKIVNELATAKQNGKVPNLQVALYEYGKSSIPASEGHLRMIVPLSEDLDKISEELFALKTNGGNEYCGQVIQAATRDLQWAKGDNNLKLIYVCGNEAFTQGKVPYKAACEEAIKQGIVINTIFCGPKDVGVNTGWQDGAQLADGSFLNIDQNRVVAVVKTPFDAKLVELSGQVNKTYVAFGATGKREKAKNRQLQQDKQAEAAAPAVAAQRAATKASGFYRASGWDLVDSLKDGKVKLKDIKDEDLPLEVRKMTLPEREAYVKKLTEERKKIQTEIQELTKKRNEFVAAEMKKQAETNKTETLDQALIKSLRTQAEKKNYKFATP